MCWHSLMICHMHPGSGERNCASGHYSGYARFRSCEVQISEGLLYSYSISNKMFPIPFTVYLLTVLLEHSKQNGNGGTEVAVSKLHLTDFYILPECAC